MEPVVSIVCWRFQNPKLKLKNLTIQKVLSVPLKAGEHQTWNIEVKVSIITIFTNKLFFRLHSLCSRRRVFICRNNKEEKEQTVYHPSPKILLGREKIPKNIMRIFGSKTITYITQDQNKPKLSQKLRQNVRSKSTSKCLIMG